MCACLCRYLTSPILQCIEQGTGPHASTSAHSAPISSLTNQLNGFNATPIPAAPICSALPMKGKSLQHCSAHRLGFGAVLDMSMMGTSFMSSPPRTSMPPSTSTDCWLSLFFRLSAAGSDRPGQLALLRCPKPVENSAAQLVDDTMACSGMPGCMCPRQALQGSLSLALRERTRNRVQLAMANAKGSGKQWRQIRRLHAVAVNSQAWQACQPLLALDRLGSIARHPGLHFAWPGIPSLPKPALCCSD